MAGITLPGSSTGKTLQAPIRGLQRAFAAQQQPQQGPMMPGMEEEAEEGNQLGTRLPGAPFSALMDVMRRFGKVY